MRDDTSLLREFAEHRSEPAFAELVQRHLDAVYSSVLRRVGGDTHLAEDVTQQVFASLAAKARIVVRHPFLSAWLFTAARHEAANAVRRERRRKSREFEAITMHDNEGDTSTDPEWEQLSPVLDAALDRLNERDRTAILLRFFERRGFAEIGAALRLSEDAARMRVDRALEKLRLALARHGVTSTAAAVGAVLSSHSVSAAPGALVGSVSTAALLGPAPASASLLTTLSAMSSSKIATVVVGAALLGTLGTAVVEIRGNHAAAAAVAEARAEEQRAVDQLAAIRDEIAAAEMTLAASTKAGPSASDASPATAPAAAAHAATANSSAPNPRAQGEALMQRHPDIRAALNAWCDAQTNFQWCGFYVAAGLDAAEIAEFQRLRRERGMLGRALNQAAGGPAVEFYAGTGLNDAAIEDGLRELLGPDRYRQYQTYHQEQSASEFAGELASALTFSAEPLQAAEFDRLKRELVERNAIRVGRIGPEYRWEDILAAARSTLSPVQIAAVDAVRAKAELNAAWNRAWKALADAQQKE